MHKKRNPPISLNSPQNQQKINKLHVNHMYYWLQKDSICIQNFYHLSKYPKTSINIFLPTFPHLQQSFFFGPAFATTYVSVHNYPDCTILAHTRSSYTSNSLHPFAQFPPFPPETIKYAVTPCLTHPVYLLAYSLPTSIHPIFLLPTITDKSSINKNRSWPDY